MVKSLESNELTCLRHSKQALNQPHAFLENAGISIINDSVSDKDNDQRRLANLERRVRAARHAMVNIFVKEDN